MIAKRNKRLLEWCRETLPADAIAAVRRLDIAWMHEFQLRRVGCPFVTARSERTGKIMSGDEVALMTAHQLRTAVGNKTQSRASYRWLREQGFEGLFGDISHLAQ